MRKIERRKDERTARVIAEAMRLFSSLGANYAIEHMLAEDVPEKLARGLLAIGFDRRERSRRKETGEEDTPAS